ncbi:flagellar hook-basal body complex protein FliE [Paraclostridium bifermentans]|uniref:flagellar hook-basal body complex protein FliE n=1 Tax=Paraclostridium bifermentans TaxID=1490 RepID=UPI00359CB711
MSGISAISSLSNIGTNNTTLTKAIDVSGAKKEKEFSNVIKEAFDSVNDKQVEANQKIEGLIKGEDVTMHDVMLSSQEAQLSMQLMIEVRNKVYEAYQELNRVQL